jgi:hypothetical protein
VDAEKKRLLAICAYRALEIPYKALNGVLLGLGRWRGRFYALLMPPVGTFVEQFEHQDLPRGPWITGGWLAGDVKLHRPDGESFRVPAEDDDGPDRISTYVYVRPALIRILPDQEKLKRRMR